MEIGGGLERRSSRRTDHGDKNGAQRRPDVAFEDQATQQRARVLMKSTDASLKQQSPFMQKRDMSRETLDFIQLVRRHEDCRRSRLRQKSADHLIARQGIQSTQRLIKNQQSGRNGSAQARAILSRIPCDSAPILRLAGKRNRSLSSFSRSLFHVA